MRIYLDSNVFISAVRDEIDGAFNLRGRDADAFFGFCCKCNLVLIISTLFLEEVERKIFLAQKDVMNTLTEYGVNFEIIKKQKEYTSECLELIHKFGIHFADAMHVILAKQSNSDLTLTPRSL